MLNQLFRKKDINIIIQQQEADAHSSKLKKTLTSRDLTMLGIAAIIGAGIFSTIGKAAYAGGPGVSVLFIITAITCGFTALCYAEFAARIPVAGSAYTYSYVAFGEIIAWIIGWALILEYAIGNIVVAISWSGYFNTLLTGVGIHLPAWMISDPKTAQDAFMNHTQGIPYNAWLTAPTVGGIHLIFNLPGFVVVVLVTLLAYWGISESKKSANFMVLIKLLILAVVIIVGFFYIKSDNYDPFFPNGFKGVLAGVSSVFYAYIGFDAISTTAEECKNPQRDLPRGMIGALIICTIIYIAITLIITGMVHYSKFQHVTDPLAFVFDYINKPVLGKIIALSAVIAATSVLLVFQIGQPRIWMSMSRDGLLPQKFGRLTKKYQTPGFSTIITGILVAVPTLFIDADLVTDLTSIGTLFAFVLVCGGVLALPPAKKDQKFKLPYLNCRYILPILSGIYLYFFWDRISDVYIHLYAHQSFENILFLLYAIILIALTALGMYKNYNLIPMLGMLCCLYLMVEIPAKSWVVFFIWMGIGLIIYLLYGKAKSKLRK